MDSQWRLGDKYETFLGESDLAPPKIFLGTTFTLFHHMFTIPSTSFLSFAYFFNFPTQSFIPFLLFYFIISFYSHQTIYNYISIFFLIIRLIVRALHVDV